MAGPSPNGRTPRKGKPVPAGDAASASAGFGPGHPLDITIPSTFHAAREVQVAIVRGIERAAFSTQAIFAVNLSLEEAIINAVKHGNKLDPAKVVRVRAKVAGRRLDVQIDDQGVGFDRKNVPDPTADENLYKSSGRGILLIESYMTSAKWSNNGRTLKMTKLDEPEPGH